MSTITQPPTPNPFGLLMAAGVSQLLRDIIDQSAARTRAAAEQAAANGTPFTVRFDGLPYLGNPEARLIQAKAMFANLCERYAIEHPEKELPAMHDIGGWVMSDGSVLLGLCRNPTNDNAPIPDDDADKTVRSHFTFSGIISDAKDTTPATVEPRPFAARFEMGHLPGMLEGSEFDGTLAWALAWMRSMHADEYPDADRPGIDDVGVWILASGALLLGLSKDPTVDNAPTSDTPDDQVRHCFKLSEYLNETPAAPTDEVTCDEIACVEYHESEDDEGEDVQGATYTWVTGDDPLLLLEWAATELPAANQRHYAAWQADNQKRQALYGRLQGAEVALGEARSEVYRLNHQLSKLRAAVNTLSTL